MKVEDQYMSYNPWPKIIKHHLRTHDQSQGDLPDKGGLSPQTVNRWINQKAVPDPKSIDKLAQGMDLSEDELMWRYIRELDDHYRPRVPELIEPEVRNNGHQLRERAETLLQLDMNLLWRDMRLALSGLRDALRNAVSNYDATRSLLETLISRFEDSYDAALERLP